MKRAFQDIVDQAGEPGKVLVVNMQGARGVDIPISEQAQELGGLHVRVTARSSISHDIDIQAENRAARSGQAGSVQYYISPQDDLIRLSPNPNVQLAIIRYNTAVDADTTHTTPETTAAVHQAENVLRDLVPQLQTHQSEHAGTHTPTIEQPNAPPTNPAIDTTSTTRAPEQPGPPPPPLSPRTAHPTVANIETPPQPNADQLAPQSDLVASQGSLVQLPVNEITGGVFVLGGPDAQRYRLAGEGLTSHEGFTVAVRYDSERGSWSVTVNFGTEFAAALTRCELPGYRRSPRR